MYYTYIIIIILNYIVFCIMIPHTSKLIQIANCRIKFHSKIYFFELHVRMLAPNEPYIAHVTYKYVHVHVGDMCIYRCACVVC